MAQQTPPKFQSFSERVSLQAKERPEATALVCGTQRVSYGALAQRVDRIAAALTRIGVGPGVNVALFAPLGVAGVEALLGILRAGGCLTPLPVSASDEQLIGMIADAECRAFLFAAGGRPVEGFSSPRLACLDEDGRIALDFDAPGWTPLEAAIAQAPAEAPPIELKPGDPFNIIYSSGTTGAPKGIIYDQSVRAYQADLAVGSMGPQSHIIVTTPLYSNTTLAGGLLAGLAVGSVIVMMSKFDAHGFLDLVQAEAITHATLVPVQIERILNDPDFAKFDLSSLISTKCTAAPARPEAKARFAANWPGTIEESYGLTEMGAVSLLNLKTDPAKLHSVGRVRPGVDLKILDEEDHEVAQGERGELVGRSPTMMTGYYNQPKLTEQIVWRSPEGKVYYRSGDIGFIDADGFLTLVDRKKDIIISGGFNIYASDLEAVVAEHPAVLENTVIGAPSERWGETPIALAVLRPGAKATAEDILEWVNARVGKTQRLAGVELRGELPRNALGKVLKRELREPYWAQPAATV